ncbi:MAG: Ig-like domain-containing protein, partial [Terriglobales bacterium]|jgi:hypothetical protein
MNYLNHKSKAAWLGLVVLVAATTAWLGCAPGSFVGPTLGDDSTHITLVPDGATVNVGQQLQFTVQLTKKGVTTDADPTLFNWVSSDPHVATVDNHGLALGIRAGHLTIQAQSKSQSSNAGAASLNVQLAPPIATLAATPEAMRVRLQSGREVSYVADGAHHLLRTTFTERNGEVAQEDVFIPAIEGETWLALDPSNRRLWALSRDAHQVSVLPVSLTGEVSDEPQRYAVDVDVFAIATGQDGSLVLHHLHGKDSRIAPAD